MPNLFPIRSRILSVPTAKRLTNLSCLELRKEIQEASRKNLRMNLIWNQFMYEVCNRVSKYADLPKDHKLDKFTPTDISLIFSSFSSWKRNNKKFYSYLLEVRQLTDNSTQSVNHDLETYNLRDIAVLYNSLSKIKVSNEFIFDNMNQTILNKINSKISEKDVALLLNGLLELKIDNIKDVFVKCSLVLSSRTKYITNLHTLTLLLHSYSTLSYVFEEGEVDEDQEELDREGTITKNKKKIKVDKYEHVILTDVTTSLLAKCAEMMMEMRPTDLLYFYKSFMNLFFGSGKNKRNIYCNIVNLYKVNNQIERVKMEFQTRELIVLMQLLMDSYKIVQKRELVSTTPLKIELEDHKEEGELDGNKEETVIMEIYRNNAKMIKGIKEELTYRVRSMSLMDCINFMNLLEEEDETLELVFRRIHNKLNRENIWEQYSNEELLSILEKVEKRTEKYVSEETKLLASVAISKITKFIKLKELCQVARVSCALGIKSNNLERKLDTVMCRPERLEEDQVQTIFHALATLGYIEGTETMMEHLYKVRDEKYSVDLLVDLAMLRVHSLKEVDEEIEKHLLSNIVNRDLYRDKLKYISLINDILQNEKKEGTENTSSDKGGNSVQEFGDLRSPKAGEQGLLDVDFMRVGRSYIDTNLKVYNYGELLTKFLEEFGEFIAKNDPKSRIKEKVVEKGFLFPAGIEVKSRTVALVPLFDDFYTNKGRMLKLEKFTELKVLEKLEINHLCVDLHKFKEEEDKGNWMANLLRKSYEILDKKGKKGDKKGQNNQDNGEINQNKGLTMIARRRRGVKETEDKGNSFSRLRSLLSKST